MLVRFRGQAQELERTKVLNSPTTIETYDHACLPAFDLQAAKMHGWVAALSATLVATVASASPHPSQPQLPATLLSDAAVDEHTATATALNPAHASHASRDSQDPPDRAAAHHDLQELCTEVPNVDFGGPQPVSITLDALLCSIEMLQ